MRLAEKEGGAKRDLVSTEVNFHFAEGRGDVLLDDGRRFSFLNLGFKLDGPLFHTSTT